MAKRILLAAFLIGMCASCAFGGSAPFQFKDVTAEVVDKNPPGLGNVFDYAFMDINDDNLLDIVLNNHHRSNPTPMYLGTADFKFKFWKNMPEANSTIAGFWLGEVDHNGDGKTDMIYTGNEGGVAINHNTSAEGAYEPTHKPVYIHSSSPYTAFIDFDGDGALEPLIRPGRIYKDITQKEPAQTGMHHGMYAISDFNNDGWPDLFSPGTKRRHAAWSGPRKLYKNNKGTLEEVAGDSDMVSKYLDGIVRTGDFNNDGHMDIYIFASHSLDAEGKKKESFSMKLFLGDGQFGFTDVSEKAGISKSKQKAGYSQVYIADIDNDGHIDIVNEGNYGTACWRNNGDGTFTEIPSKGFGWANGKHLRFDDYNMDGKLDVVTGGPGASWKERKTSVSVFMNTTENANKWLKLQLRQSDKNTMALGASVTLYKAGTKDIIGKSIMLSDTGGCHPRLHFGLGDTEKVDIDVLFPTTKETKRFSGVAANRYVVLRPDGSVADVVFGAGK